ncbi:hypothetical protein T07_14949 [Trichinella nelsoni]|uniref:Uncharacterized protein n=1 Tax=Trichinella nelsoni TaxID=6336 RepID=A0A0V0RAS2_9BILA|nr:hypothetical protein T07_14949 [Trichinella nelsoni]
MFSSSTSIAVVSVAKRLYFLHFSCFSLIWIASLTSS